MGLPRGRGHRRVVVARGLWSRIPISKITADPRCEPGGTNSRQTTLQVGFEAGCGGRLAHG